MIIIMIKVKKVKKVKKFRVKKNFPPPPHVIEI